uniref:Fatty acid synthase n=1 Tax=Caenorhabditis tropicalis TaxID=1561998 RepID=A0A1I7TJV5_9PELO
MVSPNGRLAAFDRSANGFVRAESFAVAVLCSKQFAEENNLRIHCECIGSAFNSDGKTPSLTAPNPISQYEVQLEALKGIDRDSVQLVTCHGTGTKLGDQVELTAIKKSFKPDIRVMSPKSSMGHGEGAAGLIGVLQSLYSMQQGIIPNQLHLQLPSEDLGEEKSMAFVNEEMDLEKVAISSYGFGGTNACAIITKPKTNSFNFDSYAESNVLFLSAKSHESLKIQIEEYISFLSHSDSDLNDILYTVNKRKTKYDVRAAVFGKNREEMVRKLQNGDYSITSSQEGNFEVEFGEGNEKLWLLRMLYEKNKTFHLAVDKYCKLAESCGFPEARTALFFPFKLTLTPLTYNVSRLISSMATFELLVEYNSLPNKMRGKGLGQIFCLAAAKVISFESAVQLIKGVVAEANLSDILSNIEIKTSKIPIEIQHLKNTVKKILPIHISGELKETATPNLMTFLVNGEEVLELDPIRKVQKLICQLFASGFDPELKFSGQIVKTPGYSFLKRKFWPEPSTVSLAAIEQEETVSGISASEIETTVRTIVKQFLDIDEDDVNLLESGAVDSLTSIEMVEAFGTAVNQTMPFDLLESYPTAQNIIDFLKTLVVSTPATKTKVVQKKSGPVSMDTDVNVIASDFMFAGVDGEKELWDTLLTSKLVTNEISETRKKQCEGDAGLEIGLLKQDISLFDNSFFSIAKDEAEFVDPQHRLLLHSAYNALEKSGLSAIPDADLFLAISAHSEYRALAEKHVDELDERLWMGTVHSMAAGRLAALLGISGRAVIVDTTCSSIATALEMAVNSIREGREYAVVATSQLIQSSKWLYSLKTLLDHHNTKSFSVDGTGFCRSDGIGVIILKAAQPGDSALIKISDAKSHHCGTVITPVVSAISQLLEDIGHGTATSAGDSAESMAYHKLGRELIMSSVKAQFGHCEVASGLIQLMKVAALSKHGIIPAIVHNYLPNDHIRFNDNISLPFVSEECDIDQSAIVSFGITGTKTVVTTKRVDQIEEKHSPNYSLLPISAKTKDALKNAIASLIGMIENTCESLHNISTTLQKQKTGFKWRAAVVGCNHSEVVRNLKRLLTSESQSILNNWHIPTFTHSIGCASFFRNIPEFEEHYSIFCQRLRFEPHSDVESVYHLLSVTYALIKIILQHKITSSFAVGGFNSLVLLAAIDAAPSHYLNDLLHSYATNDIRMMKRIARDVTINIENIELLNLKGEPITTARQAVDATIETEPSNVRLPQETLILSPNENYPHTESLQTIGDYFKLIGEKFTKGGQINFTDIFGKPSKLIDLPEYPFNRKHFWLPISEKNQTTTIERIESMPKDYEFLLKSEKWSHVKNHVVDSKIVLPGATSIRLVYQLIGKLSVGLTNIDFLNKITPNEASTLVKLKEQSGMSTLMFGETEAISFSINDSQDINLVPNIRLNAETHHNDDIYHRFFKSHLTYRNEFQMIDSLRYTMGKGEARFVDMKDLDILIDGTLQAIVGCYFFENPQDNSPFVPFTIDKLSIVNGDVSQKQLHTVLTYDSSENFITGDATVYDVFGNVILHISNVTFKRLNGQSAPSITSKTVDTSKLSKKVENEDLKRESKNMLHLWFDENFGWTDIDNTTGFFDLGLTSIQAVKLRNAIKSNYPNASSTCVFDYPSIELLSGYLSTLNDPPKSEPQEEDVTEESKEHEDDNPPTRLAQNPIGVMAAACRLPGGVSSPAELWELLKIGKNASSRIPATRVPTRNTLISGSKYGNPVEGGNFITQDVTQFDPAFFKISKSEAELIDPQQRILLECVQECLENSGVTETSNVGVFVGLMEKEYQDMMESSSILAMLGSMAAVIAGRINYVFGCYGPSVTIDTACSSSLVALEMAVNALLDNRCSKVIVAGVNLILNEKGQGLRTNGKMLSQHGMSLSFDSRASGYGRSDGCVVLMLELAKPTFHYMSTIQAVNVNHGGRSVSLTAPNGVAHKMLLTSVINQSPSLAIDYWEAHGTGTPLGDPTEFNTLSSILQNIIIGSVKASLGHGEASAGTCGLLKLFLMLTYQYVPTLIHFHVLNKDINAGSIRLPIIGEDAELVSAGISSFGVSGTNAAAIAFNDNNKLEPYTPIHKYYILPISAKNQTSLVQLEKEILSVIPLTDIPISSISSALANNRSHFTIRNALLISHSGTVISKITGKPHRVAKKDRFYVKLGEGILNPSLLQYDVINEMYTVAALKNPQPFAIKFAIIKFLISLSEYVEIVASDTEELLATLLADGSLKWNKFDNKMLSQTSGSVLNTLGDLNLNSVSSSTIKSYQTQPEAFVLNDSMELMQMIMNLYITGYELDWSTVYSPVEQFVALPNYQFNKQTLWYEERGEIVDHYLIGTVDEETNNELILKNQVSELRHPQFFRGKPLDVGTMTEIAIEALKIRNEIPFSIQNLKTEQITLTKPIWLKTVVKKEEDDEGFTVSAFIDDKKLFSLSASSVEIDNIELPAVEVQIPDKVVYLKECPNAVIRRHRNVIYVDSRSEVSPFRTANIVLNEIIGFAPNPSDMFVEILGVLPPVYYMVQVDDGALWLFQMISNEKRVLSNIFVLKDAKGLEIPTVRMHKKSTLLSSQAASLVSAKTLQMAVRNKVCLAVSDVIDSGLEIDENQMSTGFSELGMDSLATVDLLNRLNQKYFPEIELTTSDLFDNPNIIDLSIMIEQLLNEKGITEPLTPKVSLRERKLSIPAVRAQELAQIEFVENYNAKQKKEEKNISQDNQNSTEEESHGETHEVDRADIRRKVSSAVFDLATDSLSSEDLDSKGFTELGMDSLSIVDFVNRLNEKYFPGDDITASDVFDYPTVDELADHIVRKKSVSLPAPLKIEENALPNGKIDETEKQMKLLDQSYLLIDENHDDFVPEFTLSYSGSKFQLKKSSDTKVALELSLDDGQDKDLQKILSGRNNILISLDEFNNSVETLYMTLLNLIKSLSKNKIECCFAVSKHFSLGNSVARAFMKTITSEKHPLISYKWDQKIQIVSLVESDLKINGSWLITGGLSGIGFEIGKFLASNGAENVVLVSRRQPSQEILKDISSWKAKVHTIAADISNEKILIQELSKLDLNITGIIHSAGVLKDSKIERQNKDSFNQVFKPKADGLTVLENIEKHFNYKIDNFIMMSSFTAACGNEGQLNYGVANAYLEHQVQRRRREGKSGCAIQWGNWIDTGMATNANVRKFLADLGFLGQRNEDALKYLKACIEMKPELIMVANIDWNVILKNRKDLPRDLICDEIVPFENVNVKTSECESPALSDGVNDFEEISINVAVEDEDEVLDLLKERICSMLKCAPSKLKSNKNIMDIGLDSRLLVEFLNFINSTFKTKLNLSDAYNYSTLEKLAVIGTSISDVINKIKTITIQQAKPCQPKSKCVLMLTGQGSQYPMMGRQLVENYEVFRKTLQECLAKCDEYLQGEVSLWEILFNTDHYKELQLTKHMQPIMFCFGYATAQLWLSFGIVSDYYLGHSVGELVAGVLAGIMSIEDGLRLIVERGKAMENIAGLGALLAVQREIADDVLRKFKVCVATINSPKQVVFAGTKPELDKALSFVKGQGKQGTYVNQLYPFHSNLIEERHLAGLRECLAQVEFRKGATSLVSNVTGQLINTFSEAYIIKHTVSAVKFVNCVETLQNEGVTVWIDAGPAAVLATFVKRIILPADLSNHRIVQTCKEKDSDVETLVQSCLELEQCGVNILWPKVYGCEDNDDAFLVQFPVVHKDMIRNDEFEILEGHRLNGKIIVAGAYQMFKMDQLVKSRAPGLELVLRNVKFVKPWYIEECRNFDIHWNSNMTIELVVKSVVVCSAKVDIKENTLTPEVIGDDEKPFDVHDFYETLYRNGLQYESGFRRMDSARRSDKRCVSQLKPSSFPWPLIDSAMHTITASVVPRRPDSYFLPVAMGSVTLKSDEAFKLPNLHAQTVITSETDKFIQVNVILFAGDQIICEVRNMTIVVLKLVPIATPTPTPNAAETSETTKTEIEIVGFDITLPYNQMTTNSESWQFLKTSRVKQKLQNRSTKTDNQSVAFLDVNARSWDPEYFSIRPSEASFLDPQQRLLLASVAKLFDSLLISSLPVKTGVFIGCSTYEFSHIVYAHGVEDPRAEWSGGTSNSALAGRIAHWLKLKGPVLTIDTACSSSFYALSAACEAIRSGQCDYAIVGTVNLVLHEMTTNVLKNAKMTVNDFCKAFDVTANGYKRSETVCTMLLSKPGKLKGIANITNWATGHNGNSSSLFTPNGNSQLEVMRKACFNTDNIVGVEAHCTGTKLGDPIELNAISKLIISECSINSIKSNVGHSEGSSGLVSLCCLLMSAHSAYKASQLHMKCPTEVIRKSNMHCQFVGEETNFDDDDSFLINNFGFTGSNCSVVVKTKKSVIEASQSTEVFYPMFISAHTSESLRKYVEQLVSFVSSSSASLHDIMNSLIRKRIHVHRDFIIFNYKRKVVLESKDNKFSIFDDRLSPLLKRCSEFVKEGKIPFEKNEDYKRIELPPIIFNESLHWKLKPFEDEVDRQEQVKFRDIFYEKQLIESNHRYGNSIRNVACIGRLNLIPKIEMEEVSCFRNGIIVFHPLGNSIDDFFKLTELWSKVNFDQNTTITVCCFKNGTSHTEWTGVLRTLASEKTLPYKFVSIEKIDDLKNEFNDKDIFECIFYKNTTRYMERLTKVNPQFKKNPEYGRCLMSGGTGGIGRAVLNKLKPSSAVIISRQDLDNEEGKTFKKSDVATFEHDEIYDFVFHFAGNVKNASYLNLSREDLEEMILIKLHGAKNLSRYCSKSGCFMFSSSIACILGSFGQSNYVYANGLAASFLEASGLKSSIIHWGPWEEVGMLARPECEDINRQIERNGWKPLRNVDALSVFSTEFVNSQNQIICFDGDFDQIVSRQSHLRKFLSGVVREEIAPIIRAKKSFEDIFFEIVGINNMETKRHVPFMDLGIDSLCMENLRHTLNVNLEMDLTVSEMFENATYDKLKNHVAELFNNRKLESPNNIQKALCEVSEPDNRVAVIGWSAEFSGASNIEEFWENLRNGTVSTGKGSELLKSPFGFDNKFFNITDEDAKMLDPQVRKFIQHAYLALENSGYVRERSDLKCAVFAGAEPSDYGDPDKQGDAMKKLFVMNMNNYLATYASYCLDLKGESVSIYSACSTTLVAVANAVNTLQTGSMDIALVGAASISEVSELLNGYDDAKKTIFAKSGVCRPFDKNSEGIVRGSGVGCLVLKKYSKALEDGDNIHFVIRNFAVSNDGLSRASFMAPNPAGQLKCMTDVLSRLTEKEKSKINYVECHATGTTLGDTIEMNSLQNAYHFKDKLMIGSCKSNIGHAYAASGLAALIKCGKILQTGEIPPQANFSEFRDGFGRFFNVNHKKVSIEKDSFIAIDSFGIGGTNVHMIIELPREAKKSHKTEKPQNYLLPISAKSESSLNQMTTDIKNYSIKCSNQSAWSSTLIFNREVMSHRAYLTVNKGNQIHITKSPTIKSITKQPKLALLFAPQGIQFSNVLIDEYKDTNSLFRKNLNKLCESAKKIGMSNLKDVLYGQTDLIQDTEYAQVALFVQCLAIYSSLKSILKPDYFVGHSVGEYTAAVVGKVAEDEQMMELLMKRSELVMRTEKARMFMIWNYQEQLPNGIETSAIIDEHTKCVVGPVEKMNSFEKILISKGIKYRNIKTSHGFHSSMLEPISNDFKKLCSSYSLKPSQSVIISSITGKEIQNFDATYCQKHLMSSVNLDSVVDYLIASDIDIVVEIGPSGVLSNLLAKRNSKIVVVPTCGTKKHSKRSLLDCIGQLWNHGVDIRGIGKRVRVDGNATGYCFDETVFGQQKDSNVKTKEKFKFYSESWRKISPLAAAAENQINTDNYSDTTSVHKLYETSDLHENYFKVERILQASSACKGYVFIAMCDSPSVHLVLGLIRCYQLVSNKPIKYIENFEHLKISEVLESMSKLDGLYFRATFAGVFEHEFDEIDSKLPNTLKVEMKKPALVFGATGFVGKAVTRLLKSFQMDVIQVSRFSGLYPCDITKTDNVKNCLENLQFGHFSLVFNCAGLESSPTLYKTVEDQLKVLSTKTIGNFNILNCLEELQIRVDKFISFSSLSSIIPLFGNSDYSSANCFVEALPRQKFNHVKSLLVLSLPPLEGSKMLVSSSSSTKKMLETLLMSEEELEKSVETALFSDLNGSLFVSTESPLKTARNSLNHHRTLENGKDKPKMSPDANITVEEIVKTIWKETLGTSLEIDGTSNFFSLGGDSLSALQVVWQVQKQTEKTVEVNDLFDNPTLKGFTDFIERLDTVNEHKLPEKVQKTVFDFDDIPLTHSQMQMFMLRQIDISSKYNVIFEIAISYTAEFSWKSLKYSILSLIAHQNSYRTVFKNSNPPSQTICSLTESFHNLDEMSDWLEVISHEHTHSFDIEKTTPFRIRITGDCDSNRIHIIFNQHHILTDGWSMTVLADTINTLYNAYEGKTDFPEKTHQMIVKVAINQAMGNLVDLVSEASDYFKNNSHTIIPYDILGNAEENHKRFTRKIPERLWDDIVSKSRQKKTTPYKICLAVFCECVCSFTGQRDLLFAFANSGRNSENLQLIGYFMNNSLFKVSLDTENSGEILDIVSKLLENGRRFSNIPFHKIVDQNQELKSISIYFNFRQKLDYPSVSIPGAICEVTHLSLNNAFDFSFTIDETPSGSLISIDYNSSKYYESTVNTFSEMFLKKVNFSRAENKLIPVRRADYPSSLFQIDLLTSWKLFSEPALLLSSNTILYSELVTEIEKKSRCIQKQFQIMKAMIIREDEIVGVVSSHPPITLLACCFIGVPYAPIDPTWPEKRKLFVRSRISMSFDHDHSEKQLKQRNFQMRTKYGGIYTIFTSGSTGAPKGVFMAEQSVSSFLTSATKQCMFREKLRVLDSVKQVFDVSVSNIFGSVFNGGLLISSDHSTTITDKLQKCQYVFLPAAVFNGFTSKTMSRLKSVETLTVGGETVSNETISEVLREYPRIRMIQIYGPTETCIWSLTNRCTISTENIGSRLGEPMDNENAGVVNEQIRGNLLIHGISSARGYLTSESNGKQFSKYYSTGDIIDRRTGHIQYIGRVDNQIKWKGVRIDLSELEKELLICLGLLQITLLYANQVLIAFFVQSQSKIQHDTLLRRLKNQSHVPDHFVQVDKMPLNSSGKIEKGLLLQAFESIRKSYKREMVTMENSLEEKVTEAASQILGRPVKITEKFTDVGGNSLSSIQFAHRLTEELKFEVKAHEILQSESLRQLSDSLSKSVLRPSSTVPNVITKLREVPNSKISIYLVHAIGGTIYPYYSFLQIFPKNISVYGIEFDLKYPSGDLKELARFYAQEIASHAGNKRIFVMGHSMGGIMSREIVAELKIWGYQIPFVMLFDSWVLRTNELDIENIKQFITYVFSGLPDSEHRIDRAIKLAQLLREYKTSVSDTKLYLFKSKQLGDAAFKKAVRTDLNEELSRSMICNGFDELSLQQIETYLIDGDHESCLKIENLKKVKDLILAPFKPYFDEA